MKQEKSGRFQLDWRNILHVVGALFIGILSIYASNMDAINMILSKYISHDTFIVLSMVLAYLGKKFLTDYSK